MPRCRSARFIDPAGDGAEGSALTISLGFPDDDTVVVSPSGEADVHTVPTLRQAIDHARRDGRSHVIVDLDQLTFMDASALRVLVEARLEVSSTGGVFQVTCDSNPYCLRLLTITGLEGLLDPSG